MPNVPAYGREHAIDLPTEMTSSSSVRVVGSRSGAERFDRWIVEHPRTPVLRAALRLPLVLWRLGLGPLLGSREVRGGHLVILTVTGRASGEARHTPVVTHEVDGRTYLWCPYGDRAQWYRNLLADPVVTVQSGRSMQGMCAVGVEDVDEAVEVISALRRFDATYLHSYLAAVGVADTSEDIARNLERLHLRRLEPSREDGPPGLRVDLAWVWSVLAAAAVVRSVMVGRRRARMRAR